MRKDIRRSIYNKWIKVLKSKPHTVEWGKDYSETNKYITFSFKQLIKLVEIDLKHAYTTCGHDILKQKIGCPMGGFLSSLYADVKCAFDENKMLNTQNTDETIIYAIRIIDDLFGWIAYDKTLKKNTQKGKKTQKPHI